MRKWNVDITRSYADMSINRQIPNEHISASQKMLKYMLVLGKKIRYYCGIIIFDKGLRSIVKWYDNRHSRTTKANSNLSENQINDINSKINNLRQLNTTLEQSLSKEKRRNDTLIEELRKANQKSETLCIEILALNGRIDELTVKTNNLSEQNINLMSRCLPESSIPAMIYYAQGDVSGQWLRKISSIISDQQLYQIITIPGNTTISEFFPLIRDNLREIINNRTQTLNACEILGISTNPQTIHVIERGNAVFENNRWKVTKKAKIELL